MTRPPGWSVRLRLTVSYAGFLMLAGLLLLAIVWVIIGQYLPEVGVSPEGLLIRSDLLGTVAAWSAVLLGCLLVFGLVGGWYLAGRMLAPLTRITAAARQAAAGSLSHRIELAGHQDEFAELADVFDMMLGRLESQVGEQRRFAANASHELRTPLAAMQTMLDVAHRDPTTDRDELIDRLQAVAARARELTEALLLLSRVEQRTFARESVDLTLLVEDAVETLLPLAGERRIHLETALAPTITEGSPALLHQLAMNLLHNAIVHNREGGSILVSTAVRPGSAVLTVENTGETLTAEHISTLTEPFRRGADRLHGHDAGMGLGLAIVASITAAQAGILTLNARAGGGLRVIVRLPVAAGNPC